MTEETRASRAEIFEDEAGGEIRRIYDEIRQAMGIQMVPFLWRQFALHPPFFLMIWEQSRPNLQSRYMTVKSEELRAMALDWVDMPRVESLWHGRLDEIEKIGHIRSIVRSYFHMIPNMLITAAGLEESLAVGPIGGLGILGDPAEPPKPDDAPDMRVPRVEELSPEMCKILNELREVHGWHAVPSVFRSLARFPEFLQIAWTEIIKPMVQTPGYRLRAGQLHFLATKIARGQPHRVDVGRQRLIQRGLGEEDIEDIRIKLGLFHGFLAEVILDIGILHTSPGGL